MLKRLSDTSSRLIKGWWEFSTRMWKKPWVKIANAVLLLVVVSAALWGVHLTQAAPAQPIQFPHNIHIERGVQCLYCHPGALRGPSPGIPTETKCWGCHQQISVKNSEIDKLTAYVQAGKPIHWVPVAILPDFVYFSHRPHIAAGLNCENCHGEISQMTVARPQKMNMGWCLGCHRAKFANDPVTLTKVTDCENCHK